jgi:hypothetical protein
MNLPEAKPVQFDRAGYARVTDWRPHDPQATARLNRPASADGLKTLHIEVGEGGKCTAAWRTRVLLAGGAYVLEGRVQTRGVVNLVEPKERTPKGNGAGLRISGTRTARTNEALGNSSWQLVEFPFTAKPPQDEIELICELRATAGEAWFDVSSLRLRRAATDESSR